MDSYANPDFRVNIKRRAVGRVLTVGTLLFLLVGVVYGLFGWTLTVAVPENVTAVTLRQGKGDIIAMDVTLTDSEDVAVFTQYLSDIGKLRQAYPTRGLYTSLLPYSIILHTADGGQTTYTIHNIRLDMLKMEDSPWFHFPGYEELCDLIGSYK